VVSSLRKREGGTVRDLAGEIRRLDAVEATQEETEAYLERFVETGLLQLDLPGLGHEPDWASCLLRILEGVEDGSAIQEVRAFLGGLVRRNAELEEQGIGLGGNLLRELEEFIANAMDRWFEQAPELPRPLVYEDASAQAHARIDLDHFNRALRSLKDLFDLLSPVAWIRAEPFLMRRFFEERFGDTRVPLLTFYEVYYREHVKPRERARAKMRQSEREKKEGEGGNQNGDPGIGDVDKGAAPTGPDATDQHTDPTNDDKGFEREPPPAVASIKEARKRIRILVRERWVQNPNAQEIVLSRADLREATKGVTQLPPEPRSFSAFVTLVPGPDPAEGGLVVLPNARAQAGFGKYFSRFLYLLPGEVLEGLRERGRASPDAVLAEIAGDAAFNANLRPPIQSCEIVYPTGDRVGCPESLEVGDLEVGLGEKGAGLALYQQATDRRVFPLDLGFLNPMARPPLYQLLRRFAPASEAHIDIPGEPGQDLPTDGPVLHRPRISFEGRVVLAREVWMVPVSDLPFGEKGKEDADFYRRVLAWCGDLKLPTRSYVRAVRRKTDPHPKGSEEVPEPGNDRRDNPKGGGRPMAAGDLRKPQYMDFRSPLLVGLLRRYARLGETFALVFEECLPIPEDLHAGSDGRRWVTEVILQADLAPDPGEGAKPVRQLEAAHV
jgi:hypothetical protein